MLSFSKCFLGLYILTTQYNILPCQHFTTQQKRWIVNFKSLTAGNIYGNCILNTCGHVYMINIDFLFIGRKYSETSFWFGRLLAERSHVQEISRGFSWSDISHELFAFLRDIFFAFLHVCACACVWFILRRFSFHVRRKVHS